MLSPLCCVLPLRLLEWTHRSPRLRLHTSFYPWPTLACGTGQTVPEMSSPDIVSVISLQLATLAKL